MHNGSLTLWRKTGIGIAAAGALLASSLVGATASSAASAPAPTISVATTVGSGPGSTAAPNTRTTVNFAVTNTSASVDSLLAAFFIVVPSGSSGITKGSVTSPTGTTWSESLASCGFTPNCAAIVRVLPTKLTKSNYLAKGKTLTASISLVTPNRTGSLGFPITGLSPSTFKVATGTPTITLAGGTPPPSTFTVGAPSPSPVLTGQNETVAVSSSPAFAGTSVTVTLSSPDPGATINGVAFDGQSKATVNVTPNAGGSFSLTPKFGTVTASQKLTVTSGASTGTSAAFPVGSPVFVVDDPSPVTAGQSTTVTVRNATFSGGSATVSLGSTDARATFGGTQVDGSGAVASVPLTSIGGGAFTFDATFFKAMANQKVTVTSGPYGGSSAPFAVDKGRPVVTVTSITDLSTDPLTDPALPTPVAGQPFEVAFTVQDSAGNAYDNEVPFLYANNNGVVGGTLTPDPDPAATDATGHGSVTASYDTAQNGLEMTLEVAGARGYPTTDVASGGVAAPATPDQQLFLDLGIGGPLAASVDLGAGAYGTVSLYQAPLACDDPLLPDWFPCDPLSPPAVVTLDALTTDPDSGAELYGTGVDGAPAPASITLTCDDSVCPEPTPTPSASPGAPQPGQVASGSGHGCAVQIDGTVGCWGDNSSRQARPGDTNSPVIPPATVDGLSGITAVTAGNSDDQGGTTDNGQHTCAIESPDGFVWCWGDNGYNQLGHDDPPGPASTPRVVLVAPAEPLQGISQIAAGARHTCAIRRSDGSVWCWGSNFSGELGPDALGVFSSPYAIQVGDGAQPGLAPFDADGHLVGVFQIAAGAHHTCAVTQADGSVWCWGDNSSEQSGAPASPTTASLVQVGSPGDVNTPLTGMTYLAAGRSHTCAATSTSNTVYCWGDNAHQQLGVDDTAVPSTTYLPVSLNVPIDGSVYSLAAGSAHTCAVGGFGFVYCWGDNALGQSGTLNSGSAAVSRQNVDLGGSYPIELSAADQHTCVRLLDWSVTCWGDNGQGAVGTAIGEGPSYVEPPTLVDGLVTTLPPPGPPTLLDEYNAYPIWVSIKKRVGPDLVPQPYALALPCRDAGDVGTGQITSAAAQAAGYCVDVDAIQRDDLESEGPPYSNLSVPVLFDEDIKLAPGK